MAWPGFQILLAECSRGLSTWGPDDLVPETLSTGVGAHENLNSIKRTNQQYEIHVCRFTSVGLDYSKDEMNS